MSTEKYEYEMFFKSESEERIKIDGWMPISTNAIRHPERIEEYLKKGILRRFEQPITEEIPTDLKEFIEKEAEKYAIEMWGLTGHSKEEIDEMRGEIEQVSSTTITGANLLYPIVQKLKEENERLEKRYQELCQRLIENDGSVEENTA